MKISKRLQAIADMISEASKVIDVGCDHALLDIYLSNYKKCHCIAADINSNALEQARYNIKRMGAKNIEVVQTDGLNGIAVNEEDYVVISGMGVATIEHILKTNKTPNTLIISAHNDWEDLRKKVVSLGYKISEENFIIDKGKGYIIIKFEKGFEEYSRLDLTYGPFLQKNIKYLTALYAQLTSIYDKIPDSNAGKENKKKQLDELKMLMEKLNN